VRPVDDRQLPQFFGQRLRHARRRAHLSQEDLGIRLGVRQDTISHYETGQCRPDLTIVWRLALILQVDVGYFFPAERLLGFGPEEQEMLALLTSLSPGNLNYVMSFIRTCAERQQRRQFLLQDVLVMDPQRALLVIIQRDLQVLEGAMKTGPFQVSFLEALVEMTSILLMAVDLKQADSELTELMQRVFATSHRLICQLISRYDETVRA
jgi:transcriptional regulator with XRE-family HTH domain